MVRLLHVRALTALAVFGLSSVLVVGCSSTSEDNNGSADVKDATQTAVPVAEVQTSPSTGYVMLNGIVIVPSGSSAICTRQAEKTTAIIGDIGSNTAASVILDDNAVTYVSITDPEDTLTLTPGHGNATMTVEGETHTVSGEAPGVRKAEVSSGEMPMTFELSFSCS